MAITISNVYIQTFERNLRHLAQQMESRLRRFVTERATGGEKHNWERLGAGQAAEKTSARTPTPTSDLPWTRRVTLAKTYHAGETVEPEDIVQMLVDPNSNVALNLAMAMKRQIDDIIIESATASALNGDGSSSAFTAGQTVGNGLAEISLDLILQVQQKFYENDIDPDEKKVMVISPIQQRKLMQLMEVTSGDFQNSKALSTGMLPDWMGFDWVVSNRLLAPAVSQLDCLAFSSRGIGLQVNKDITAKVAEDPSLSFAWRIYCMMVMGAVRVEDEHVVRLHVADTVT
ncbi:hypothetical protein JKY79_03085 [Candidatus Babeliales bacterium]|nr:hypothetical protein [Candidatus Babeliales bacterium]